MKTLFVPEHLRTLLNDAHTQLAISISGGKDSQAMLATLVRQANMESWKCRLFAVHADLGRVEWAESFPHCQFICKEAGIPLVVVRRAKGDLLSRWQERMNKLAGTGKPFWSSARSRYCTSELKRGPIDRQLRHYSCVISAEGIRAEESRARADKSTLFLRPQITSKTYLNMTVEDAVRSRHGDRRLALTWYPIHSWKIDNVWQACGTSAIDLAYRRNLYRAGKVDAAFAGWPAHPAYVTGNSRVSCVFCILGSKGDLANGARLNPELHRTLIQMEKESGFTFQSGRALSDILKEPSASGSLFDDENEAA